MVETDLLKVQEIQFQADRASQITDIYPISPYVLERYRNAKRWQLFPKEFVFKTVGALDDKDICDFGCGDGVITSQLAKLGANVTAVDISPELIEIAKKRAFINGIDHRVNFIIADVEKLELPVNKYDFVIIYEVLHHIPDISGVLKIIIDCLKPGGKAIIVEPIACSPLLKKIRSLIPIPQNASVGERQLSSNELDILCHNFKKHEKYFYHFIGRITRFLPNANKIDHGHPFTKMMLIALNSIDRFFITLFPQLWRFYGIVVFIGTKS